MPELPEVETSRLSLSRISKGKRITEVSPDYEDAIVFDQASPETFRDALVGARITGTGRKGKYFWLELDRRPWPVFHLGMTGNVEIRRNSQSFTKAWGGRKLWSESKRDPGDQFLAFCRVRITLDDDTEIAITDPRRFGRIRLAMNPLNEPPISRLGPDPLLNFPSASILARTLAKRRAPIKAVLLDQSVFAGVGNWIADEVLFQSKISPHRLASKLSAAEVSRLRIRLLSIIRRAVKDRADYDRYPKSWLFHHRWGKDQSARTALGLKLRHDTIGGRTTAWVPQIQR